MDEPKFTRKLSQASAKPQPVGNKLWWALTTQQLFCINSLSGGFIPHRWLLYQDLSLLKGTEKRPCNKVKITKSPDSKPTSHRFLQQMVWPMEKWSTNKLKHFTTKHCMWSKDVNWEGPCDTENALKPVWDELWNHPSIKCWAGEVPRYWLCPSIDQKHCGALAPVFDS